MGRVEGKKAIVTGAAQGLGEAISRMFAAEGAKVCLTDINGEGVEAAADRINQDYPGAATAFHHDVTSEDRWKEVVAGADAAMGGISILVNNAGIGTMGNVEDESFENFQKVHAIDANSVFLGSKYALPIMRQHQPGAIVNISSIAGLIASHNYVSYNSAKAAVWMMSKSIALHCAKVAPGIRCNSVHPTFIDTPILDGVKDMLGEETAVSKLSRQVPLGRLGEPNDVAYAVLFLASDESKFITGAELKIDGGISAM
ncbi:MAG: SDR family oxidoreductase [Pseudomonadota bacterium]